MNRADSARVPLAWVKFAYPLTTKVPAMSNPTPHQDNTPSDPVEDVVPLMPIVLPLAGAVLMFLLAFIAISMA